MLELNTFKALLGLSDDSKDTICQFILDDVKETILNFCNIDDLPAGLEQTAYRMAVDIYKNNAPPAASSDSGDFDISGVSSIKIGDVSISAGDPGGERSSFISSLLKRYETTLRRYRKVRWDK